MGHTGDKQQKNLSQFMLADFQFMHQDLFADSCACHLCVNIKPLINSVMKKFSFLFVSASLLLSCTKDKDKSGEFKGPEVQVHDGKAWTSLKLDKSGTPLQLSVVLNDAALNSVPVGGDAGNDHAEHTFILPYHPLVQEITPYKFTMLNWNPNGHDPDQVYTFPHFDIHYYMSPVSEVMTYTDDVKMNQNLPAGNYLPSNHVPANGIPMMGKHWVDITSPELNGTAPFTQTFIYGSYDSKVVFYEPMITLDFLKNTAGFERSIPQPAKFQKAGYYPTKLTIKKHDGLTEVSLDGFIYRQAS